jgi:threonine dehydratase
MSAPRTPVTPADIEAAAGRLDGRIRRTPVFELDGSDLGVVGGASLLVLKLEQLQHAGSFKARGALNALLCADRAADGVVAASGGNHGVAVAWAARRLGIPANIFVPEIAAAAKIDRLEQLEATVHRLGREYSESLAAAEHFAAHHEVASVHAYDQPEVMAGAGTLARELDDQAPDLDTVVVACGGGGLAGGLASWWGTARRLVVVETGGTPTFARALDAGGPVDVEVGGVGADALGARRLGTLGWEALTAVGAESVLVEDAEVLAAQELLWRECRLRVEPAGAAALAALRSDRVELSRTERVAVIVCGANVV